MSQSPQLWMVRPDLANLPTVELPEGYRIRSYQPGDAAHWTRLLAESFSNKPESHPFDNVMRKDPAFRPERMLFACRGEEPVGTTSAWYNPATMPDAGVVHWVGVVPAHTGKRLGYWLVLTALHRMAAEGRKRSYLMTDDFRLPAIKTYLNCGFTPLLVHENQRERWRKVFADLGLPELCERFRNVLDGPVWKAPRHPPDSFDYEAAVRRRRRWLPERAPGRPQKAELDALGDESLYRPSSLGSAGADPAFVGAGEDRPLELWYRAGHAGIPEGTEVVFFTPGQNPLGTPVQARDPDQPGFVEVTAPPHVIAKPLCPGFRIEKGRLREGDEVRMTIGRTAGFVWTPLAGRREFKVIVDVGGGEPTMRLPEPVLVRVGSREADHIDAFLPPTAKRGETLRATVTVRDRFDNRVPYDGPIHLQSRAGTWTAHLTEGIGRVNVGTLSSDAQRVEAVNGPLPGRWRSNWSLPVGDLNLYIGDMHCHDLTCPAEGYAADVYRWAIEDKRLDFLSVPVQAHAYQDNDKWLIAKHMAETFLDEGRFVTFLAFEWQHSHYGDKVIHYLGGDMPFLPVDEGRYDHPAKLYEALRQADAFIISHHPGYELDLHVPGTDWASVETDVDRLVEIWSMHGSSEGYDPDERPLVPPRRPEGVMEALRAGLRMGVVGGSDSHSARPGGSAKEPRPYWGGLCAVWAKELTRRSLFEAFRARRTYALTGARMALRFWVNGALMGAEIPAAQERHLAAEVWATQRVKLVQFLRNGQILHEDAPDREVCRVEFVDRSTTTEAPAFYHCRVTQQDGHLAVCSPVWVG